MRFAYIDSQGNEVPIPSVEALGLRIELGAIGPDTQLYDAQSDRWGPASTHEIFHTLSRQVTEEGHPTSVPPVAPPSASPGAGLESELSAPGVDGPESDLAAARADHPFPPPAGEGAPLEDAAPPEAEPDFDLTDEFLLPFEDREENLVEGSPQDDDLLPPPEAGMTTAADLDLDLTLVDADNLVGSEEDAALGASPGGVLDGSESSVSDGQLPFPGQDMTAAEPESPPSATSPGDPEDLMDFSGVTGLEGGLDLEPPLSEFTGQSLDYDAGRDEAADGLEAIEFGPGSSGVSEEIELPEASPSESVPLKRRAERPIPRNRPSPPRRVRRRSRMGPAVVVVLVAAVGAGGWLGWHWYQGRGASRTVDGGAAATPAVILPDIPPDLLPKMRQYGETALAATLDRMGGLVHTLHLAAAPDSDWLAGVYMANASRYQDVQDYWMRLGTFVDSLRTQDTRIFHDEYRDQLSSAGVEADTARILLERADSGFAATRGDRQAAYSLMDDLVTAALDLHRLLTDNESEIQYDPAAGGVSRDPVLEAVPKTKELGTEMWSRVDRITAALDALGALDKVTTERLTAALLERIRRASFE